MPAEKHSSKIYLASIRNPYIDFYHKPLLQILFYESSTSNTFISVTKTNDELSLILDYDTLQKLIQSITQIYLHAGASNIVNKTNFLNTIQISNQEWACLKIIPSIFNKKLVSSQVTALYSKWLSERGISIMHISSAEQQFIMVEVADEEAAIECIKQKEADYLAQSEEWNPMVEFSTSPAKKQSSFLSGSGDEATPSPFMKQFASATTATSSPSNVIHKHSQNVIKMHLITLRSQEVQVINIESQEQKQAHMHQIVQSLFFADKHCFWSITCIQEQTFIICDTSSPIAKVAASLSTQSTSPSATSSAIPIPSARSILSSCSKPAPPSIYTPVHIHEGALGFTETGIVATLSQPLAKLELNILYFSTFLTDYALVKIDDLEQALQSLTAAFSILTDEEVE